MAANTVEKKRKRSQFGLPYSTFCNPETAVESGAPIGIATHVAPSNDIAPVLLSLATATKCPLPHATSVHALEAGSAAAVQVIASVEYSTTVELGLIGVSALGVSTGLSPVLAQSAFCDGGQVDPRGRYGR